MSLQTMKKKGVITCHGSKISGKPPGGYWVSQGPGAKPVPFGYEGFSINGGRRNRSYIGKDYRVSRMGTPYYGQFPIGWGGTQGQYPRSQPLLNFPPVLGDVAGVQYQYIKPSSLTTRGMLRQKYRYLYTGKYPNYWVQPVYPTGTLSDNASQQVYIDRKAAANITVNNTNKPWVYAAHRRPCVQGLADTNGEWEEGGATGLNPTQAGQKLPACQPKDVRYRTYDTIAAQGYYTKTLRIPQDASQYTLQVQRPCSNPTGAQKPFPFATSTPGITSRNPGPPPPISTPIYLSPPDWYTAPCKKK
jgi:hypothetical protein